MMLKNNTKVFLELLMAGLWEQEVCLSQYDDINFEELLRIAEEQTVVGLVAAGLDHVVDKTLPQKMLLQFVGEALQLEQQNKTMNAFISRLIEKMRAVGIYTLLVKGQGIAQCYERPLWRASGDVDLYLSESNYKAAKEYLTPLATHVDGEDRNRLHQGMTILETFGTSDKGRSESWVVELHGKMHSDFSKEMNKVLDEVHQDLFCGGNVRSWNVNGVPVFLPSADNDVILIFTHILEHFFIEGVGLRQICDWCRLLWTYKDSMNYGLLESRIQRMGLMTEWKAFYNLASRYLGMPDLDSELTIHDSRFDKKADRIMELVLESGNFGHNKDLSYRTRYSGITYKIVAAWRRLKDFAALIPVFPLDAPKFYVTYVMGKVK